MTKSEVYNLIVDFYYKHGQGIPSFARSEANTKLLDELIEEGKLKVVRMNFSYLPDGEFICLTKGYCVEENMRDNYMFALSCIRVYRNVQEIVNVGKLKMNRDTLMQDKDFMERYTKWIDENKEKLEEKIDKV